MAKPSNTNYPNTSFFVFFYANNILKNKGDFSAGDTPLPIPNREVKPSYADDTAQKGGKVGSRLFFLLKFYTRLITLPYA